MKEDETYLKQIKLEQIESVNIEMACINKAYKLFSETIKELKDKNLSTSPRLLELYTELGRHKLLLMSNMQIKVKIYGNIATMSSNTMN